MNFPQISQIITLVFFIFFSQLIFAEKNTLKDGEFIKDANGNIIPIPPEFRGNRPIRIIMKHTDEEDEDKGAIIRPDGTVLYPLEDQFYSGAEGVQRNDLKNERLINFRHNIISDKSIGVFFTTGSNACFGSRAVLQENVDSIGIAVVEGEPPGAPDACGLVGQTTYFILHTKKPIGNRKIIHLRDVELK